MNLTSSDRRVIVAELLLHRFEAEEKELKHRVSHLALAIYNDVYSARTRAAMAKLPKDWLPTRNNIEVQLAGQYEDLAFITPMPFLAKHFHPNRGAFAVYDAKHPFTQTWEGLDAAEAKLRQEKRTADLSARSFLQRFRDTKRLLAEWPEVRPYLPATPSTPPLPSIPIKALNHALRLP